MPYLYKKGSLSSSGGTGETPEYTLPTFHINTDTMELIATQSDTDPIVFSIDDNSELLMEA